MHRNRGPAPQPAIWLSRASAAPAKARVSSAAGISRPSRNPCPAQRLVKSTLPSFSAAAFNGPSAVAALAQARDDSTVITNVMTGRPARGIANRVMRELGPISPDAPEFPHAATGLAPLKAAAEKLGKVDFTNLWAGQAIRLGREMPAEELTRALAGAALARLSQLAG